MTTTILLTALIVALLAGILLLLPRLARPTLPFGVRVPESHIDAPAVRQATNAYDRGVIVTMLVVAVALIAMTPITSSGVVLTAASLLPIAAWLVPYLSARRTDWLLNAPNAGTKVPGRPSPPTRRGGSRHRRIRGGGPSRPL